MFLIILKHPLKYGGKKMETQQSIVVEKEEASANNGRIAMLDSYTRMLLSRLPGNLLYHCAGHTLEDETGVVGVADKLARKEGISPYQRELVVAAAYLHDAGYIERYNKNEAIGARIAGEVLPLCGYDPMEIDLIQKMILATEMPANPKTHLEKILCDADVDNLGRNDFFEKNDALRREIGVNDLKGWYENSIKFMESHQFYTASAKNLRQAKKDENILELKKRAGMLQKRGLHAY